MMIRQSKQGLEVALSPDDCVVLSNACRIAADETQEGSTRAGSSRATSYVYYLMACCLDGYALASHATGYLGPDDHESFDLNAIKQQWSPLPKQGDAR